MSDERKYRQRGYQDAGPRERKSEPRGPVERDPAKGPRGRGLGAPTASVFRCAACNALQEGLEVAPPATCAKCGGDLHTCSNCRYFDSSIHNECRQNVEPRVMSKTKRNECALFEPKVTQEFDKEATRAPDDPRSAFDALFKI